ncbi:MAG TPA: DUF4397 domain-containing protein [Candidatus Deferrimicrobiaceae bacterium]|nr:DUF4397 domain-containing protein [Candidatus Deferrimicrobiaceae bacterium]
MNFRRLRATAAALTAVGVLALATSPVFAAGAEKLTAVVTANDQETPTAGQAWVRVLHGSPDTPSVDVYVGADIASAAKVDALSGLEFGDISDYVEVAPGTYAIKVCATADSAVCPIEVPSVDLAADTKYTIAASDLLASIDVNVFVDDPNLAEAENAQVRVVHLSADTPAVDVLTQAGDSIGIDGLSYPDRAPASGYASLAAGSYDLKVCASADNALCPLDPAALDLQAGTAYSVFAIGSLEATLAPPPTTTIDEPATGSGSAGSIAALVLLAFVAVGLVGGLSLAGRRVESR